MICQCKNGIRPELVAQLLIGQIYDAGGDIQNLRPDGIQPFHHIVGYVVESLLNSIQRNVVGRLTETDAFPEHNHLIVLTVQTK